MKRMVMLLFIILFFSSPSYSDIDDSNLGIDTKNIDQFTNDLIDTNDLNFNFNIKDITKRIVKGEKIIDVEDIKEFIKNIFLKEIKIALGLLSKIIIVTIISSILNSLQSSFENSSVSELSNIITYMMIAILVITSFNEVVVLAKLSIDKMINFMQILMPLLLTLLVIAGGPNTNIIFHPMILSTVNIIGLLIKNFVFPLIYFSFIISVLSNISGKAQFKNLTDVSRKVIIFTITGSFTIFIGLLTIYGLATKVDGISIRTAKFAIDNVVPIVGKFLSDSIDAVIGSIGILKNGIGIAGLVVLSIIIVLPMIKISTILFIYNLILAITEPIASKNIINFFEDVSKNLTLILVSIMSLSIMFFITITIIVDAGNNLLMLR
ncbi:MAG: stage III sporulation protein AE [Tissierella sp.]|uniref:stage III sporulation protein AE n=1 Tax=Tissierella sp. TaxID=41274 RepID=UPI003F9A2071